MSQTIQFGLGGRAYVVTGGAQGIGEACVRRLVREGASVAVWDQAEDAGRALAAGFGPPWAGQGAASRPGRGHRPRQGVPRAQAQVFPALREASPCGSHVFNTPPSFPQPQGSPP